MPGCHPWKGRRTGPRCSCRHGRMMTAFDLAAEVWRNRAETETSEYATELAEYKAANPMPQLAEYMTGVF